MEEQLPERERGLEKKKYCREQQKQDTKIERLISSWVFLFIASYSLIKVWRGV